MTKGEIDRLGDLIRVESTKLNNVTLEKLEDYRKKFKNPLADIFNIICQKRHKIGRDIIVTYRIKRIESIINKLIRYPEMRFSRMGDIGGCRIIVKNNLDVYKIKEIIEERFIIQKENDYIKTPQEDGYKSLHLYVSINDYPETIEVQIRNIEDHNWSTLVEISDLIFDSGIKEYHKDKILLEFHKLLGNINELNFNQAKKIADIEKSYKYFESLNKIFSKNYLDVREQWLEIEHKSYFKYFLIESKKNETPKIEAFSNFTEAENAYFEKYKYSNNSHVVLTHLQKPEFNQVSIAYSNYILTTHDFEYKILSILEKVVFEYLKNRKLWQFYFYYSYYQKIRFFKIKSYLNELETSYLILESKPIGSQKKLRRKYDEWKKDLRTEMKNYIALDKKFVHEFRKIYPNSSAITKLIVKNIIKYTSWKFNRRVGKEIKSLKKM